MRAILIAAVVVAVGGTTATAQQTGTVTDSRDGQTYKTVTIGKQTWMAQNLNYQTKSGSWCYNDSASYCKKYGRLYDWETAMKICPAGFHLPSRQDWDSLGQAAGGEREPANKIGNIDWYGAGKKLKARSGWNNRKDGSSGNGTDDFGFSALPGGYRNSTGFFDIAGKDGFWWTATEGGSDLAYYRFMYYYYDFVYENHFNKGYGYSVRCVKE